MLETQSIPQLTTRQPRTFLPALAWRLVPQRIHPDGLHNLALAILIRAVTDSAAGNLEARAWMLTESPVWFQAVGLSVCVEDLQHWAECGFYGGPNFRLKVKKRVKN